MTRPVAINAPRPLLVLVPAPSWPVVSNPCVGDSHNASHGARVHTFLRLGTPGPALNLRPRYNLAPSQNAAVVRDEDGERRLSMLRWGLIPGWAKDPSIGHKLINARAETAAVKPSFRAAYSKRRCLVPADGFYEWRREGEVRQPWLIAPRDGGIVAFAGLWERWSVPEGAVLRGSLSERRSGDIVETFIGQPALHRRRDAKRLVDPAEVVVERVEADHAHPY